MRYMLLIYKDEKQWEAMSAQEQDALVQQAVEYSQSLREKNAYLAGDRLMPTSAATTVRMTNGHAFITDGPFAETKEQLAGYNILEAANLDEALKAVARHPLLRGGLSIEVRPLRDTPPVR